MSFTILTGGLSGTVTPLGSGTVSFGTKPAGGWKFDGNVLPLSGVIKVSGNLGNSPGVDTIGTNCSFPSEYEPSGSCFKSPSFVFCFAGS